MVVHVLLQTLAVVLLHGVVLLVQHVSTLSLAIIIILMIDDVCSCLSIWLFQWWLVFESRSVYLFWFLDRCNMHNTYVIRLLVNSFTDLDLFSMVFTGLFQWWYL